MKKQSKISSDGKNLLTRIPKEIEELKNIKKGDKINWELKDKKLSISLGVGEK